MKTFFIFIFSLIFIVSTPGQTAPVNNTSYGITFSFPWLNFYNYYDYIQKTNKNKSGFFGLGIAGFYVKDKNKISFNWGTTEDLSSPIGIIDYSDKGSKTSIASSFAELIYHRPIYHSFGGIAGFNFTNYNFHYINYADNLPVFKKVVSTLGGSIGIEYIFNKSVSVATIYRPCISSFDTDGIYRHLISIDLRVNLELRKKK